MLPLLKANWKLHFKMTWNSLQQGDNKLTEIYEALRILSEAFGIEHEYVDNWGKTHQIAPETVRQILNIKGIKIIPERMNLNPQVTVVSTDKLPDRCSIFIGSTSNYDDHELQEGTIIISHAKGEFVREYRLPSEEASLHRDEKSDLRFVSIPFPKDLSIGRHELDVKIILGDKNHEATCCWIICPTRAHIPSILENGRRIAGHRHSSLRGAFAKKLGSRRFF